MTVIYVSLVIALMLIVGSITPVSKKYSRGLMITGIVFYLVFILASISYNAVNKAEEKFFVVRKTNIKVNSTAETEKERNAPIGLEWQAESAEVKKGKTFTLKLTITNRTKEDIDSFKLIFPEKKLQDQFSISQVNPRVNIEGKKIIFGRVKKGESMKFVFDLVPKTTGLYSAKVEPLGDDDKLIINDANLKPLEIKVIQ